MHNYLSAGFFQACQATRAQYCPAGNYVTAKNLTRQPPSRRLAELAGLPVTPDWRKRPGSPKRFCRELAGEKNISLFHCRLNGGDFGRILVGPEFPEGDDPDLSIRLNNPGYTCLAETGNAAYRLFL